MGRLLRGLREGALVTVVERAEPAGKVREGKDSKAKWGQSVVMEEGKGKEKPIPVSQK